MRLLGGLLVAAVLALSACGDDDDAADTAPPDAAAAGALVESYLAAIHSGDGETACAMLTPRGRELLERAFAETIDAGTFPVSCEQGTQLLAEVYGSDPSQASTPISDIKITDERAHVTLEGTSMEPELVVVDGEWMIDGGVEK